MEYEFHWDWPLLADDAVVVRGGTMLPSDLFDNATAVRLETVRAELPDGTWGICGGAATDVSAAEIIHSIGYPGKWMRQARLGALRMLGFEIVMVDEPPKAVILLGEAATGDDWEGWERLVSSFGPPEPNPAYG